MPSNFPEIDELIGMNSKEANEFVEKYSFSTYEIFIKSNKEKEEIKSYFISLLAEEKLYDVFYFDKIVYYFTEESENFTIEEKERILAHISNNFIQMCKSKNDMIPFTLLDFISREINSKTRKRYAYIIKCKYNNLDDKEIKCLDVIENTFFYEDGSFRDI